MKVLLVYPEFPETYWSFKHALRFMGKCSVFPPLGLLTVSSLLPANWQRRIVDLNVRAIKGCRSRLGRCCFLQRHDRSGLFPAGANRAL